MLPLSEHPLQHLRDELDDPEVRAGLLEDLEEFRMEPDFPEVIELLGLDRGPVIVPQPQPEPQIDGAVERRRRENDDEEETDRVECEYNFLCPQEAHTTINFYHVDMFGGLLSNMRSMPVCLLHATCDICRSYINAHRPRLVIRRFPMEPGEYATFYCVYCFERNYPSMSFLPSNLRDEYDQKLRNFLTSIRINQKNDYHSL